MAARGYVHSARAFPRALIAKPTDKVADKVAAIFSPPRRHIQRRAYRLLRYPVSSTYADWLVGVRSMATGLASTLTKGPKAEELTRQKSSYEEAVMALNSLQSNAETIRKAMNDRKELRKQTIPAMIDYIQRVGLSLDDVDKLSVIHVTGTKGKGSTCAFADSILRQYGYKTGLFSSPHLIEVRERIRIDGQPIGRELFSTCFWEVFNRLQASKDDSVDSMPHYFSFLTVMALYVFVRQRVDVAVLEVGIGGQYDSTNVVRTPVVCGVSSLDFDHTKLLGHTLEEIAWHKAGIFKRGAQAITVPQPDSAMQVILNRSVESQCPVSIAAPLSLEALSPAGEARQLGICGDKQRYNAALALHLCRVWLRARQKGKPGICGGKQRYNATLALHLCRVWLSKRQKEKGREKWGEQAVCEEGGGAMDALVGDVDNIPVHRATDLSPEMIKGLCECRWPGRTQVLCTPGVTYYLDGAHTADSIQQCVEWFRETADKEKKLMRVNVRRVLLFNMTGDRPVTCLLKKLKECDIDMAAFCPNVVSTIASKNIPDQFNKTVEQEAALKKSRTNRQTWDALLLPQVTSAPGNQPTWKTDAAFNGSAASSLRAKNGHGHGHDLPSSNGHDPLPSSNSHDLLPSSNSHDLFPSSNGHDPLPSSNGQAENGFDLSGVSECFPCIASSLQWATGRPATDLAESGPSVSSSVSSSSESRWDVNENAEHLQVLVTGSLHLVGGVLKLLTPGMND